MAKRRSYQGKKLRDRRTGTDPAGKSPYAKYKKREHKYSARITGAKS